MYFCCPNDINVCLKIYNKTYNTIIRVKIKIFGRVIHSTRRFELLKLNCISIIIINIDQLIHHWIVLKIEFSAYFQFYPINDPTLYHFMPFHIYDFNRSLLSPSGIYNSMYANIDQSTDQSVEKKMTCIKLISNDRYFLIALLVHEPTYFLMYLTQLVLFQKSKFQYLSGQIKKTTRKKMYFLKKQKTKNCANWILNFVLCLDIFK